MNPTRDIITGWLAGLPTMKRRATINADTELIEEGVLDSLAILDLVAFLEDRFKVVMPVEEFVPENFRTPATIAALAERLGENVA